MVGQEEEGERNKKEKESLQDLCASISPLLVRNGSISQGRRRGRERRKRKKEEG